MTPSLARVYGARLSLYKALVVICSPGFVESVVVQSSDERGIRDNR
jgi:hypothetical protein